MYGLELVGDADVFATYEAESAASSVELIAPGLAVAGAITDTVHQLAYTRRAIDLIGRTDASISSAKTLLQAGSLDRDGTVAVRARDVRSTSEVSTQKAEQALGQILVDRGFDVDLGSPDHVLRVLFSSGAVEADEVEVGGYPEAVDDSVSVCLIGWTVAETSRDFQTRKPTARPFFQPGSMAPIDARAYANIAGAGPGQQVLDPMCGTGGMLLEAGLVGSPVLGIDAQKKMVHGCRENLDQYLKGLFDVIRGDATALPFRDSSLGETNRDTGGPIPTESSHPRSIDGIVFDAPYGRQSKIARHELQSLVEGALEEAIRVIRPGGRTVLIADRSWRNAAVSAGWQVDAVFRRPVHRSLDRFVHVLHTSEGPIPTNLDPSTE